MKFSRFTLLQSYFLSIQKNKRKALLLINIGIFFSIFAVSSAIISFFIEMEISKKQSEILEYQVDIKEANTMITDLELMFNQYRLSLKNEENNRVDKQFFSETKLGNKVFSENDFYIPFIQYSYKEIQDLERSFIDDDEIEGYGAMSLADLFNVNNPFNQEIIELLKQTWSKEDVDNFTDSIIKAGKAYKTVKKINFENYKSKKFQTFREIALEVKEYESLHVNNSNSKLIDDYFDLIAFEYAIKNWFEDFSYFIKSTNFSSENTLNDINEEILVLSKKEKNIILLTFLLQFLVFVIIQIFEVNSINLHLKKRLS